MTGLETNIFPITNLAELSSTYRLYLIRGLRQDQAEYHQNRQIIARKLGITRARTNLPLPGPGSALLPPGPAVPSGLSPCAGGPGQPRLPA